MYIFSSLGHIYGKTTKTQPTEAQRHPTEVYDAQQRSTKPNAGQRRPNEGRIEGPSERRLDPGTRDADASRVPGIFFFGIILTEMSTVTRKRTQTTCLASFGR